MASPSTIAFMLLFTVALTAHQVLMKVASNHDGLWWYAYMGIGYVIGIVPPICLAMIYRNNNAVLALAITNGVATPVLYTTMYCVFRQPVNTLQWSGLGLVCLGSVLLFMGPLAETNPPWTAKDVVTETEVASDKQPGS